MSLHVGACLHVYSYIHNNDIPALTSTSQIQSTFFNKPCINYDKHNHFSL